MIEKKLDDFIAKWFIGNFNPAIIKTSDFEIAIKEFNAGEKEPIHIHKKATEMTVVLKGQISIMGTEYIEGDIITVEPNTKTDFYAVTDTTIIMIKTPSIPNDREWVDNYERKEYVEWFSMPPEMFVNKAKREFGIQKSENDIEGKIYIVTYRKNDVLNENLASLWKGTKDIDKFEVVILANHPDIEIYEENLRKNIRVIPNFTRSTRAWGNLAKDWNFCLVDCFKDWTNPDNIKWCILAQNDVKWLPDWQKFVEKNKEYDFISQPVGDQLMYFTIEAVRKIGFFDERFSTLHLHEQDYFTRAISCLGNRVSINDGQSEEGKGHLRGTSCYNAIGNVLSMPTASWINYDEPEYHNYRTLTMMSEMIKNKYGIQNANDIFEREKMLAHIIKNDIKKTEINWYPFFWQGCKLDIMNTFIYSD